MRHLDVLKRNFWWKLMACDHLVVTFSFSLLRIYHGQSTVQCSVAWRNVFMFNSHLQKREKVSLLNNLVIVLEVNSYLIELLLIQMDGVLLMFVLFVEKQL